MPQISPPNEPLRKGATDITTLPISKRPFKRSYSPGRLDNSTPPDLTIPSPAKSTMSPFVTFHAPGHFRAITPPLRIIRLAFFYFSLTFLTGCTFGALRVLYLIPVLHIDPSTAEIGEMPFMLVAMAGWARFIVVRCKVPEVPGTRLAIGLVALGFTVATELGGRWVVDGRRDGEILWSEGEGAARAAFAAALGVFGLMPWLLMVMGTGWQRAHISHSSKSKI